MFLRRYVVIDAHVRSTLFVAGWGQKCVHHYNSYLVLLCLQSDNV